MRTLEVRDITDPHVINAIVAMFLALLGLGGVYMMVNWNAWVEAEKQRKRQRNYRSHDDE
jgi:uncharacterized protein (DUF2062 family)